MSCRSTHASSSAVSFAHASTGLDETQIQSLFHDLKREGAATPAPTDTEYADGIAQLRLRIATDGGLREGQRDRLLRRVGAAANDSPLDGAAWHATVNIKAQADMASNRLADILGGSASYLGVNPANLTAEVERWRTAAQLPFEDVASPQERFRYDLDPQVPHDERTARALRRLGYEEFLAQPYPVFVYGTLRRGQGNYRLLEAGVTETRSARAPGIAVYGANYGFPYAAEHDDPEAVTVGEISWLSQDQVGAKTREDLDGLEGFRTSTPSRSHYERVLRPITCDDGSGGTTSVLAWMYVARGSALSRVSEKDRIHHGDWVAASDELGKAFYRK